MKEIRLTSLRGIKRLAELLKSNEVKWLAIYLNSSPYLKKKRPKFHQKVVFSIRNAARGLPALVGRGIAAFTSFPLPP